MSAFNLLITILVSLILSGLAIPWAIKLSESQGWVDLPGKHKRHKRPVPIIGGLVLFAALWLAVALVIFLEPILSVQLSSTMFYIFLGGLIIVLVGLSDDLSPLPAWVKLLGQIAAGLTIYIGGLQVELLTTPWGSIDVGSWSPVISIGWVVVLTNAINLIDGLDGLAAGVSLISAITMTVIGHMYNVGASLIFLYAMIGFLIPFLYFNKYPAKIFLGDSGSMQIGYYFAVVSLVFPIKSFTFTALYVPLLVLAVPVLETASSIFRRLLTGKNVMKADRRHLFHYLALGGLSYKQVIFVFYSLAVIFGLFALAMFLWDRVLVFTLLVLFMVVILVLFLILVAKLPSKKGES